MRPEPSPFIRPLCKYRKKGEARPLSYVSLTAASHHYRCDITHLPYTLRILLENVLRCAPHRDDAIHFLMTYGREEEATTSESPSIPLMPVRVLMQDFTAVPAVVDLASMRSVMEALGKDPSRINPRIAVDLVIDHSVTVDHYASKDAFMHNVRDEFSRNQERYRFLKWAQNAFSHFRVVPPGTGICHQVNLEYLASVVHCREEDMVLCPDVVIGTDSHTTMVNGLGVLGWGVGGIEAEAAMLGQALSMEIPQVVGVHMHSSLSPTVSATDLVLTVTERLRQKNVVGKFVEFFGEAVKDLSLADRATLANMAPEYGATCGYFPVDEETCRYLKLSGRDSSHVDIVEAYAKAQGLWALSPEEVRHRYHDIVDVDLSRIEPSLAGPSKPQDRVSLVDVPKQFASYHKALTEEGAHGESTIHESTARGEKESLSDGHVVIAAITSCTNTSNPYAMLAAGLLAQRAVRAGLKVKAWVKTSLAPGSAVVRDYLEKADVMTSLEALGFHIVGYGCMTCIGNSGPLKPVYEEEIRRRRLCVASVLSGNRNFEGRIHPLVRANYLTSPLLVVAYALAGSLYCDMEKDPLGVTSDGAPLFLRDILPQGHEVRAMVSSHVRDSMFKAHYGDVFKGTEAWQRLPTEHSVTYDWQEESTYVREVPFFEEVKKGKNGARSRHHGGDGGIRGARPLVILGDSITTDHISPAGAISPMSAAADYLTACGVAPSAFNSYGARRGNHEVMVRGTFANVRLRNRMVAGKEGGYTRVYPQGREMRLFEAAQAYRRQGTPLIVIAGKHYGAGSSRDWAAKGPRLLGVRAVIASSFERIHRSNLVGMGILPLVWAEGIDVPSFAGCELFDIEWQQLCVKGDVMLRVTDDTGALLGTYPMRCCIHTDEEMHAYNAGGILPFVLQTMMKQGDVTRHHVDDKGV